MHGKDLSDLEGWSLLSRSDGDILRGTSEIKSDSINLLKALTCHDHYWRGGLGLVMKLSVFVAEKKQLRCLPQ